MHYLHIIYSQTADKYYVGETSDVMVRVDQHNSHYFKNNFTKRANDWNVLVKYECRDREEALFLEKFIKKMKSRVFIEKVIANPEILKDILRRSSP